MAQSYIDKYVFALMLDSSNFEKGANLATKAANGIKSTLLKTYTALGGIDLFKNMLTDYTSAAHSIDLINTLTGENIVQLQAWEKAIQDTGGNVGAFRSSLRGLNDSLAQFKNFGQADNKIVALFRQGIMPTDSMGNWKKGTDLLKEVSKALKNIKDESSAWTWASAMGIDEGTFRMMRMHGEQLDDIIKKNERYALIKKTDIEISRQYDLMISDFKTSWLELSQVIMSTLLPVIQKELFPAIRNGVEYFRDNKGGIVETIKTICDLVLKTAGGVNALVGGIKEIAGTQGKNVGKHGAVKGTLQTAKQITKDAESFWGTSSINNFTKGIMPGLGAASAVSSYVIHIGNMEVKTDNAEGMAASVIDKAGQVTELNVNTGTAVQTL